MNRSRSWVLASLLWAVSLAWLANGTAFAGDGVAVEDRFLIQDLIALYGRNYDDRDAEGWAALFTPTAPMPLYIAGKLARELTTNEERTKWAQSRFETFEKDGVSKTRHYQTNTLLVSQDDGAVEGTTVFFVTYQYATEVTPRPIHTGIYRDRFVKTPDGWRFARREIYIDHK
jgi:3-phenylpropionate/cinnamic acid dioxygenase small subunit